MPALLKPGEEDVEEEVVEEPEVLWTTNNNIRNGFFQRYYIINQPQKLCRLILLVIVLDSGFEGLSRIFGLRAETLSILFSIFFCLFIMYFY